MRKRHPPPFFLPGTVFAILALSACGGRQPKLVPPPPSATAVLQKDLSAIFEAPEFERSIWSVLIRPLSSGSDLYSLNASKLVMPGSNMKLLTLAAAVDRLG